MGYQAVHIGGYNICHELPYLLEIYSQLLTCIVINMRSQHFLCKRIQFNQSESVSLCIIEPERDIPERKMKGENNIMLLKRC